MMAGDHVVVVDDDPAYLRLICPSLESEGYRVTCGVTGEEALALLASRIPDLIVLEVTLPGIDGFEVCRRVREVSTVPIIFLTSRDSDDDKVEGLLLGADDYITKPLSMRELLARVNGVLRRARWAEISRRPATIKVGNLQIDPLQRRVTIQDRTVALSPTEFRLLYLLAASSGIVLTHEYLLQKVWGPSHGGEREILRAALWRLRHKLEQGRSNGGYIVTSPGVGYMLTAPV